MTIALLEGPDATAQQISGQIPGGRFILSVIAKRTYEFDAQGRCSCAQEQLPLVAEVQYGDEAQELITADSDLYQLKPATDVVVMGHIHARHPTTELAAGIRVANNHKLLRALGSRRAMIDKTGRILFSSPEPFTNVPLCFTMAYGGRDEVAEKKHGIPAAAFAQYIDPSYDIRRWSPYLYPRNPVGRGYVVEASKASIEALELPQLEDIEDRLLPGRLVAGHPLAWTLMPVPQSLGWLGHGWFPRCAYFGTVPEYAPDARLPYEVRKGWVPEKVLTPGPPQERFDFRAANGASLGLQLPYLKGDESVVLYHLHPRISELRFRFPGERPKIWTDGRKGKINPTVPVIHHIVIEPDLMRFSIVWRGSAPALRPYLAEELATMPLRVQW